MNEARCQRLRERGRSEKTIAQFDRHTRQLGTFLPRGLHSPVSSLSLATLEAFERQLRNEGIATPAGTGGVVKKRQVKPQAAKTVRDATRSVRSLIKFSLQRGWLDRDPSVGYQPPPAEAKSIIVFSGDELESLFADPLDGMGDIWRFMVQTCLRANEFTWLLKNDVRCDAEGQPQALLIRQKLCPQTMTRWQPKHNTHRTVPLTREASAVVASAMAASEVPWAFQSPDSRSRQTGRWTYSPLLRRLHVRLKNIGVVKAGLHRLRHTGATYLANSENMPIVQLQKFLGHHDLKQTQRYLNPRDEQVADAIRRIDFNRLIHPSDPSAGQM